MKKIIIILFIFSTFNVAGQPFVNSHDQYYQKHSGYIELNNGEKINEDFQYASWEFPTYNLKLLSPTDNVEKRYYITDISKVVLAGSNHWLTNVDSTYFIVHDKCKHFYRQLTFGKDFQLYDGFFSVDEYAGLVTDYFLVKTKQGFIELNSAKKLKRWLKENYPSKIDWRTDITVQDIIRQLNGKV